MDVINFNEKVSKELLQKQVELEQNKQSLLLVSDTIQNLTKECNDRATKCKGFKDAFNRPNIDSFLQKEIKNFDSQSLTLESIAQNYQGNVQETLQKYLETRKTFHQLQIIKAKLPEIKFQ